MKKLASLLISTSIVLFASPNKEKISSDDLKLKKSYTTDIEGSLVQVVEFGGDKTPVCKVGISNDGKFFLTKIKSTCKKQTNSKGEKLICNSNKSVCKTRDELLKFVNNKTKKSKKELSEKLFDAVKKNDINAVKKLVKIISDVDFVDEDRNYGSSIYTGGPTPLYEAIKLNHMKIADILIKAGADINKNIIKKSSGKTKYSEPVLYYAAGKEKSDVIKRLLEKGANPKKIYKYTNGNEETPLFTLAYNDNLIYESAKLLINYGVDAKKEMYSGGPSALYYIIKYRDDKVNNKKKYDDLIQTVKLLVKSGADVDAIAYNSVGGEGSVMLASEYKDSRLLKTLLDLGAKLDVTNNYKETPLHKVKSLNTLKFLVEHGLKKHINKRDKYGNTPILEAFGNAPTVEENLDILNYFIKNGAKVNVKNKDGETLLRKSFFHYSKSDESDTNIALKEAAALILIKSGIDVNAKDKKGKTVLDDFYFDSLSKGDKVMISFLLQHGLKTNIKNKVIKKYFDSVNSGDLKKIEKVVTEKTFDYIVSEVNGKCKKGDTVCQKKYLIDNYGAKSYKILNVNKNENKYHLYKVYSDGKYNIESLYIKNGRVDFGTK